MPTPPSPKEYLDWWDPLDVRARYNFELFFNRPQRPAVLPKEDLPKINEAFKAVIQELDRRAAPLLWEAKARGDNTSIIARDHTLTSIATLYRDYIIPSLIRGKTLDEITPSMITDYQRDKALKVDLLKKTLPIFCKKMGLTVPECTKEKQPSHVIIIDDSLDMDLKERAIHCKPEEIFKDARPPVIVHYASSVQWAQYRAAVLLHNNITPRAIICDYKLHRAGEPEQWGDKVLAEMLAKMPKKPANVFLISKSGFKDEDRERLARQGITYAHSNELHAIAAFQTGDTAKLEFATQVSKTSNLREWANAQFGTHYPTGIYTSPNVVDRERHRTDVQEVVKRIERSEATQLEAYQLLDRASVENAFRTRVDASGVDESRHVSLPPGITGKSFVGQLALSAKAVEEISARGDTPVLFVLDEGYTPGHNALIEKIDGLVMLKSGTQHIAVMARNKGIPVAFARAADASVMSVKGNGLYTRDRGLSQKLFAKEGDTITFDGTHFQLYKGSLPLLPPDPKAKQAARKLAEISANHIGLNWHVRGEPDYSGVRVMANIGSHADVQSLLDAKLPCHGIGLVRSEHFLRSAEGMACLQAAVIRGDGAAMEQLRTQQKHDYARLFDRISGHRERGNFPVTIRLLDAPPSEFFPNPTSKQAISECAAKINTSASKVLARCQAIYGQGLHGTPLALEQPKIYEAQCEAIFAAAKEKSVQPRILVPHIRSSGDLKAIKAIVEAAAEKQGMQGHYQFGPMLETKSTVLTDDSAAQKDNLRKIAEISDFVSFGTNDLTQELLGLKRGDLLALAKWQANHQKPYDPFVTCDEALRDVIANTTREMRKTKPLLHVGICGQHASSAVDAQFFQACRINSVSVPPTEESLCCALIQSGAAALHQYTQERERLAALKAPKAPLARRTEALPKQTLIQESPVAFVLVEDDPVESRLLSEAVRGYPAVVAQNLSSALKQIHTLASQGKRIVLISDMEVPFGDQAQRKTLIEQHGWIGEETESTKWGVTLANAAKAGRLPGVDANCVSLMTAGNPSFYGLDQDIRVIDKAEDAAAACCALMDSQMKAGSEGQSWAESAPSGKKRSSGTKGKH